MIRNKMEHINSINFNVQDHMQLYIYIYNTLATALTTQNSLIFMVDCYLY